MLQEREIKKESRNGRGYSNVLEPMPEHTSDATKYNTDQKSRPTVKPDGSMLTTHTPRLPCHQNLVWDLRYGLLETRANCTRYQRVIYYVPHGHVMLPRRFKYQAVRGMQKNRKRGNLPIYSIFSTVHNIIYLNIGRDPINAK